MPEDYPTGWYALLDSKELKQNKLLNIRVFSIDFVLWRKNNFQPVIMLDKCPHRSAKLSLGKIVNNCVECPFHGFQFSAEGNCHYAPEFQSPLPAIKAETFPCREENGLIYIKLGNLEENESIPWPQEIDNSFTYSQITDNWNSDITRCIENQLDFTHLPFVHRTTIGRGFQYDRKRLIQKDNQKIEIFLDANNKTNPNIQFYYPNLWINRISSKFFLVLIFVPVETGKTKFYLRSYQKYVRIPILQSIFGFIVNKLNFIIFKQDKKIVLSQGTSSSINAKNEVLMENDLAIRFFRKFWSGEKL